MDESYVKAVQTYAKEKKNYLFHNLGNDHALVIFVNIFNNASGKIRIAANNLWNKEVVNTIEYLDALRFYLEKKSAYLDIMLSNFPEQEIKSEEGLNVYRTIHNSSAFKEGRVRIKIGHGYFTSGDQPVHFCTADDHIYRFEEDIQSRRALCNFNDSEKVSELNENFDSVFDSLEDIDLGKVFDKGE